MRKTLDNVAGACYDGYAGEVLRQVAKGNEMTYDVADLLVEAEEAEILLRKGEALLDPTSTKGRKIYGPALVHITRYPDGGIDILVKDAPVR